MFLQELRKVGRMDFLFLGIVLAFFALSVGFARLCQTLRGEK
jgi:hypothetical protein